MKDLSFYINNKKIKYFVGIDEVGRGPLAGHLCVSALVLNRKDFYIYKLGKDSKKLSKKDRLFWFDKIKSLESRGTIRYKLSFVSEKIIDSKGLSFALKKGIKNCLDSLKINEENTCILLDGGLKAEEKYIFQKTIIKGDELIPVISLASIVAKVTRDKKMTSFDKKYPNYGFKNNNGYGTVAHINAILKYGISPIHRRSFCKKML